MTARDLTMQLRAAARANMPAVEAQRFSRFLRGLESRSRPDTVPGTPHLPAITIDRPTPPPKAKRWTGDRYVWKAEPRQGELL